MEGKILESFKKYTKEEFKDLDLFVSLPDDFGEDGEYLCSILENCDNGKAFDVTCTKNGKVIDVYEM